MKTKLKNCFHQKPRSTQPGNKSVETTLCTFS